VEFCEGLIQSDLKIKFGRACGRANELVRYKETTWELLRRAGLHKILIGSESANNKTLEDIDKNATVEDTVLLAKVCEKHNINLLVCTILGLPIDDYFTQDQNSVFEAEFKELYEFYKNLYKSHKGINFIVFIYSPLPATPLYDKAVRLGFSPPRTLSEWSNYVVYGVNINWIPRNKIGKIFTLNYISLMLCIDFSRYMASFPWLVRMFSVPLISFSQYICKLRLYFNFFSIPVDRWLFNFGKAVFRGINRIIKMANITLHTYT
jgi:hypothetical protein